ncbi:MAG: AAA family ATPase [Hamadaea sp.]|nr:AAA family ATPase [Hamadaea sp.]NUO90592.1 AAA family ATPase [Dermatophilaceae bacterium]
MTDRPRDRHLAPVPDDGPGWEPPFDRAAEEATIAAALTNPASLDDITQTVTSSDFYDHAHELIYDAIVALYSRTRPVDKITVANQLGKDLDRARGRTYLEHLTTLGIGIIDGTWHAQIVAEHAALRRLQQHHIRALADIENRGDTPALELYQRAADQLEQIPRGVPGVETTTVNTWAPVDLAAIITGDLTGPAATLCTRRDGKQLLYPYAVHSVSGEPGSGKTWMALVAIAQEITAGHDALMLDFEDRPQTIVARLLGLGATPEQILTHLRYIRPEVALTPAHRTLLEQAATGTTIAVIDGITEAMTLHGLSLMDNEDVARWLALVPRVLADLGPAVLQIDHVVKNADNRGRYAIGGQHKLAGITGVAYKMLTIKSFGQGAKGHAKLVVDKDKHGDVGPNGITAADLHLDATDPGGTLYAWLSAPEQSIDEEGHFRPTVLMERVSQFLLVTVGPQSLAAIQRGVKGKAESIAEAVDALVREGFVRVEPGPRGSQMHHLLEAFEGDR